MRKGVIVILAVAIIGALGVYIQSHDSSAHSSAQSTGTTASSDNSANTISSDQSSASSSNTTSSATYKDGTYSGDTISTEYGDVQVAAVISSGKIIDVKFLQMPSDEGRSREVTMFSESPLKQSTLNNQSAHIDFVSGATTTSQAYEQSIQAALNQAV